GETRWIAGHDESDRFGNEKRRSVAAVSIRQQTIRLLVADDLFGFRVEAQLPPETIRRVRKMDQRARDVPFRDRGAQVRRVAAPHAADEVGEMIVARLAARSLRSVGAEPALVAE